MPGLRSLRNRLAVVFGLIVLGAIGTIYLSVTPRLEEQLRKQRLQALETRATRVAADLPPLPVKPDDEQTREDLKKPVSAASTSAGAEILVLRTLRGAPQILTLVMDSSPDGGATQSDVQAL